MSNLPWAASPRQPARWDHLRPPKGDSDGETARRLASPPSFPPPSEPSQGVGSSEAYQAARAAADSRHPEPGAGRTPTDGNPNWARYAYQLPAPAPEPHNGFGITALVLGIVGCVLGLIPILGIPAIALGLIGLVFGGLALRRIQEKTATNKVMSWFGAVLSAGALVLGVIGIVIVTHAFDQLKHDLNTAAPVATPSAAPVITPTATRPVPAKPNPTVTVTKPAPVIVVPQTAPTVTSQPPPSTCPRRTPSRTQEVCGCGRPW